jgi:hypothetical protein
VLPKDLAKVGDLLETDLDVYQFAAGVEEEEGKSPLIGVPCRKCEAVIGIHVCYADQQLIIAEPAVDSLHVGAKLITDRASHFVHLHHRRGTATDVREVVNMPAAGVSNAERDAGDKQYNNGATEP